MGGDGVQDRDAAVAAPHSVRRAVVLSFVRFPLLLAGALVTGAVLVAAGHPWRAVFNPQVSTLYFVPVNLLCWWILARLLRSEGTTPWRLAGFDRRRAGADAGWGLVWFAALYLPFVIAVVAVMAVLYGADLFARFATVFATEAGPAGAFAPWLSWVAALVAGIAFPLTNAPVEELYYRGYAQSRLAAGTGSVRAAVLVPTAGFALQHVWLAPTVAAIPVFLTAFFVWGFGAALVRQWQGRVAPLIVAHLFTNLAFGIVPLVLLSSGASLTD